jgi:anti-sigma B factor antagonist
MGRERIPRWPLGAQAESDCIRKKSLAQHSARQKGAASMDISTRQIGDITIVDVVGEITLYNSPIMRKTLIELLREKRLPRVIVNLEKVKYIDSAGVASLVEGLKISRDLKSGFALYGLSRTAREVLELTKLIKVFEVHESEEEALRGGGSASPAK